MEQNTQSKSENAATDVDAAQSLKVIARLMESIERAPHAIGCKARTEKGIDWKKCNCWKRDALKK